MQELSKSVKHLYDPYEQKPVDYYDSKEAKKKEERKVRMPIMYIRRLKHITTESLTIGLNQF